MTADDTTVHYGQRVTTEAADADAAFLAARRKLDRANRRERRRRWGVGILAAALVGVFLYFAGQTAGLDARDEELAAMGQRNAADIAAFRADLRTVCRQVPLGELPDAAQQRCQRAESEAPNAPPVLPDALTNAEVLQAVKVAVDDELAARDFTTSRDLLPVVRRVVQANLPDDGARGERGRRGPAPTDEELLALIRVVYDANPPQDGADATQEQADAALALYCSQQPGGTCEGADGSDGADGADGKPGRGIVSRDYQRTEDGGCVEVATYNQPPTEQRIPVGSALCDTTEPGTGPGLPDVLNPPG